MTDIVERLRDWGASDRTLLAMLGEAADEIERMRKSLRWIEDHANDPGVVSEARLARIGEP